MCVRKFEREACACQDGSQCRQNYHTSEPVTTVDGIDTHKLPEPWVFYYQPEFCRRWTESKQIEDPYGCPRLREEFVGYTREGVVCTVCTNGACRRLKLPN